MDNTTPCPNCSSTALYRSKEVSARGNHGPDFLPGLGGFLSSPKLVLVVCRDCGLLRFFAQSEARAKLRDSKKWKAI